MNGKSYEFVCVSQRLMGVSKLRTYVIMVPSSDSWVAHSHLILFIKEIKDSCLDDVRVKKLIIVLFLPCLDADIFG